MQYEIDAALLDDRVVIWEELITKLADEGVPVRAIARAVELPSEEIRRVLNAAAEVGEIVEKPQDDWPADSGRMSRRPAYTPPHAHADYVKFQSMRVFKLTPAEARIFAVLLRNLHASKEVLHNAHEDERHRPGRNPMTESTDKKIIDVLICKIRTKVTKPFGVEIATAWGSGYEITPDNRKRAYELLGYSDAAEVAV